MRTNTKKPFLNMDERNKQIANKVISIMYFLTIIAMVGIIFYRQFKLGQAIREFEDIAVILTVNSLFLISALLYFGAIPVGKIKTKSIVLIYFLMIILGSIFTYVKYNIFESPGLSFKQLFEKLIIIILIISLILLFYIIFSILGNRKLDKEIE